MGWGGDLFLFTGRWAYNWVVIKLRTNNSEHCWPNNVGGCCVRLHVAKSLNGFKLCAATPPNNTQQMQQDVQTDSTCNIQQCWELLTNNREFKHRRRRRQRGRQKSSWFRLAKQQLCTCTRFSVHFFAVTARQRCEKDNDFVFLNLNFDTVL